MRIFSLLVALLCGLVSVCVGLDPSQQNSSPRTAVHPSSSELLTTAGIIRPDFDAASSDRSDRDGFRPDPARDEDLTCYTIDSYRVKRQSRDSDVTEPVGHSTCQRASKFSVKSAEEPASNRKR